MINDEVQTAKFPTQVEYDDLTYYATGKTGTNRKTSLRAIEMEADDYSRVWVAEDGRIFPE